jgi:flagellar M-ring protein FliF
MNTAKLVASALAGLGGKRLVMLGGLILLITAIVLTSSAYLNRPARETLYSGLDSEDVNLIGAALSEFSIAFDVDAAGKSVLVDYGQTARARMLLAERGLPRSDKSGYELFDQMGSLGLTSFMQQVTRVRALEGELIRTIQQLDGVKTARVHLAIKADSAFRSKGEQTTASVVIRTQGQPRDNVAASIRQIVAAAIPGLRPEHVTVTTTDGGVLASGGYGADGTSERQFDLEARVARETEEKLERTISAIVGMNNLRVSVTPVIDMDKRQITETKFDPESKVERSTKTTKESDQSQNQSSADAVTVEQNVPQEIQSAPAASGGQQKSEKKEETINYEVNSSQLATVSEDYKVERLSIAVVINKQALFKGQDGNPGEAKVAEYLKLIANIVKSATGFDEKRGDTVDVSAFDFVQEDATLEPLAGPGMMELAKGNLGTIINALAFLAGMVITILMGLRPALKMILAKPETALPPGLGEQKALPQGDAAAASESVLPAGLEPAADRSRDTLNKAVELDIDRAAQVLKQWLDQPEKDAA